MSRLKALRPVVVQSEDNRVHSRYFACPACGHKVGGYLITGPGRDDWETHEDNFCVECGQQIKWTGVSFFELSE